MKILSVGALSLGLVAAAAAPARAQMRWLDRGFVNVNGGVQGGSDEFALSSTFPFHDETATIASTHETGGSGGFDLSAGARVWRNLAVSLGYSRFTASTDASIAASAPHELLTNTFRSATLDVADLDHKQSAVHLSAVWVVPVTDKIDIALMAGPSFFSLSQQIARSATIEEVAPPDDPISFDQIRLSNATIEEESERAVGGHVGVDFTYLVTRRIGAGILLRWAGASVDLPTVSDAKVGGFQFGAGARVRF
jgi:hypothetical protein